MVSHCLKIVRFCRHLSAEIIDWPLDADEAQAWGGRKTPFPVTYEVFINWHEEPAVQPFVAFEHESPVAYGELWVDREDEEIELARIIVKPQKREMGIGQTFVRLLITQALMLGMKDVYVRVVPHNRTAIHCYESAGFVPVSSREQELYNQGQPADYLWLQYAPSGSQ